MPSRFCSAAEFVAHLRAQPRIEVAERLVEQQHLGLEHQRARDRHPLLLAARQRRRRTIRKVLHLDQRQRSLDALADLGFAAGGALAADRPRCRTPVICGQIA